MPGLQVNQKFQILIPTMAEAALETLLLLMYLWFQQLEQKLLLLHLLLHFQMRICAASIIYNAVFAYNFNSLMHLRDRVLYF